MLLNLTHHLPGATHVVDDGERGDMERAENTRRELFIHELAEVRGGDPEIVNTGPLWSVICSQVYSTMACGEEYGPCAPSGC